jgi:hypothetical protein
MHAKRDEKRRCLEKTLVNLASTIPHIHGLGKQLRQEYCNDHYRCELSVIQSFSITHNTLIKPMLDRLYIHNHKNSFQSVVEYRKHRQCKLLAILLRHVLFVRYARMQNQKSQKCTNKQEGNATRSLLPFLPDREEAQKKMRPNLARSLRHAPMQ